MLRWSSGRRPRSKIPLGPPLEKGEDNGLPARNPIESPFFVKGGWGDFFYGHGFHLSTCIVICAAPYGSATLSGRLMDQSPRLCRGMLYFLVPSVLLTASIIFSIFRQLLRGILATYNLSSNGIVFALNRVTKEQMNHKALARMFLE